MTIILEAKFHRRNGNNHSNCNNKNGKIDEELAITYYMNALNEIRSFAEFTIIGVIKQVESRLEQMQLRAES